MDLSDLDLRIIEEIRNRGVWAGETALARRLRVSRETLAYKLDRMRRGGVITGYALRLNPYKFGFREIAYVYFSMKQRAKISELCARLRKVCHLQSLMLITGDYDFAAKVLFHDSKELHKFMIGASRELKDIADVINPTIVTRACRKRIPARNSGRRRMFRSSAHCTTSPM